MLILSIWLFALGALLLWLSGNQKQSLTIAGGPAGSETLALSTAIADVINASAIGIRVRVFETGGSGENLQLLEKGRVDLAEIQADISTSDAVSGVMRLYQDAYHLIVNDLSTIADFSDLAGKRVAIPPVSSGQYKSFWFLAEHYGIAKASLSAEPMSEEAADFAMANGQVDAVFRVRTPGNASIRSLISSNPLHMVALPQADALGLKQPVVQSGKIPLGSYRGFPPQPIKDLETAVLDRLLVARTGLESALVYKFTKAVFDRRSEIIERSHLAGFIGPLDDSDRSTIPVHEGARRYFDREKPSFLQENARIASASLSVLAVLMSAVLALRSHWVRSRRVRMGTYNNQLMSIAARVRNTDDLGVFLAGKNELIDILGKVMKELEQRQVSEEEFEHFSFTWQSVDALVRDQLFLHCSEKGLPATQPEIGYE